MTSLEEPSANPALTSDVTGAGTGASPPQTGGCSTASLLAAAPPPPSGRTPACTLLPSPRPLWSQKRGQTKPTTALSSPSHGFQPQSARSAELSSAEPGATPPAGRPAAHSAAPRGAHCFPAGLFFTGCLHAAPSLLTAPKKSCWDAGSCPESDLTSTKTVCEHDRPLVEILRLGTTYLEKQNDLPSFLPPFLPLPPSYTSIHPFIHTVFDNHIFVITSI